MVTKTVIIYTDGSCLNNPGTGGYGAVLKYGERSTEISEGYRKTTNNRMELMAVIKSLQKLNRSCKVVLYSDSRYICDNFEKGYVKLWQSKGWRGSTDNLVRNVDLWQQILDLVAIHESVEFRWVAAHSGVTENERCDRLAKQAAMQQKNKLLIDQGYEDTL